MSSIPSLGKMVSGLVASQKGLQVTGHNISNINTPGYIRQQVLQHDSSYLNISGPSGLKQVGQGVSITEVRQIRDELADKRLRTENSVLNFYTVKQSAVSEVESILGEPHGSSISKMLDDFWKQTQKLGTNPSGIEERLAFLQTADVLMKKANHIMQGLNTYQEGLNKEVIESVDRINTLLYAIKDYNDVIVSKEINGDIAHDLRDQRNLLLDELSSYMDIDYYEERDGRVTVRAEGREVIDGQFVTELDLKQTKSGSAFLKPVWKNTGEDIYRLDREVNSARENDTGRLQALLIARGDGPADATTSWDDIALNDSKSVSVNGNAFLIPKIQKELSMLIQEIAKTVNGALDGTGMGQHTDEMGVPVFVPIASVDGTPLPIQPNRADFPDANTYNVAMQQYFLDIEPHLVGGNIKVNPSLLADDGYNNLGTVTVQGNIGDNTKVTELLEKWSESRDWPPGGVGGTTDPHTKKTDFMDFYAEFVADIGREGFEATGKMKEKNTTVTNIENERQSMGGVSQDEELANMIKYQHSYNASSRMITVLDDMLDTIINRM
ncbi:MAG: flagellar hook-associated protein FlgK [Cellulosilyticaceae bacterium]